MDENDITLPPPAERRAIREAAGVSREALANQLNVSPTAIMWWERGTHNPGRRLIAAYAESLDWLRRHPERRNVT